MISQSRAALAFSVLLFGYGCATASDSLFDDIPGVGEGGNGGASATNSASASSGTASNGASSSGSGSSSSSSSTTSTTNSASATSSSNVGSSGSGIPGLDGGFPDLDGGLPEAGLMCTSSADCMDPMASCCLMGLMICFADPGVPGFCLP